MLSFGRFELQPERRLLLQDGEPLAVGARAFDVLLALAERRDRLVGKAELLDVVWPGLVVEENNLQVQISALRKLLGAQAIMTVPGRGYRFTAAIEGPPEAKANHGIAVPSAPPAKTIGPATLPTNLPAELPPLYGRVEELRALRALIETHRLVSIVGAGGIGKSRLAQAVAHSLAGRWADGVWLVELAGLSDPALLPNVVAQVLNLRVAVDPGAAPDQWVAGLAPRTMLLVLDNCEHLLEAAAALAQAVLLGAPHITLLTTSQEPLHLPAEQQYRLMPLALPSEASASGALDSGAIALFEARVRAVNPRFALNDDNLAAAVDICRRLDGLPLAIELAAARVGTLGLGPVRDKLDARFRLLTGGSRATLRRHQTLRAALEWSHNLLGDADCAVFRRLAVFAGGFTMEMAQAVAADAQLDEWAVLDHLSALVDKSLVEAQEGDSPRYRLLESARAFGLERLAASDETAEILKRHALAVRHFVERVDRINLDGDLLTDQLDALLLPELDNLRVAHAWATGEGDDMETAAMLAACGTSLENFAPECADWVLPLQRHVEEAGFDRAVTARYWRAVASNNMSGRAAPDLQLEAADRAQSLYKALGDSRRVYSSLVLLAECRLSRGHDTGARAAADEARALVRPDWPGMLRIRLLRFDGYFARSVGRLAEAHALVREAVRVSVSTGDWLLEVMARDTLADLTWQIGPIEDAAREACCLADDLRARPAAHEDMFSVFYVVVGILSEAGRIDEASATAHELLPIMRRARRHPIVVWAHLFWRRGQTLTAARLLGAFEAKESRDGGSRWANGLRLIAEARAGLVKQLPPDAFASALAAGAALGEAETVALISESLARTDSGRP